MTSRRIAAAILILGFAAMLAWNAPGQMSYDSVLQLADGRSGAYNSWHPPLMAWLLGLFDAVLPGTLLFLIFQSGLLLAALLLLRGAGRAGAAVALLIVLTPQWLLFQGAIWKDVLFADAAIAGFACLVQAARHFRWWWIAGAALLLTLAACTRQNGVVLLPVAASALGLIAWRQGRRGWRYGLGFLVVTLSLGIAADLALTLRGDGGDGASAQLRLLEAYDLTGTLAQEPHLALPLLAAGDPALESLLRTRGTALYTPLRNDPFAADPAIGAALSEAPDAVLRAQWLAVASGHPLPYLRHRLAVFAATLLTPDPDACHIAYAGIDGPPAVLKTLGLTRRIRPQDRALVSYARAFAGTPVLSHLAWGLAALGLLAFLLARRTPEDLAMAGLLAGALLFTMTFVIISIACDYRYLAFLDLSAMAAALHVAGTLPRIHRRPA